MTDGLIQIQEKIVKLAGDLKWLANSRMDVCETSDDFASLGNQMSVVTWILQVQIDKLFDPANLQ